MKKLYQSGPYWAPGLSAVVKAHTQTQTEGSISKKQKVTPLPPPCQKKAKQEGVPTSTWKGKGPHVSNWFVGEVVNVQMVGQRGKKTRETGTHPCDTTSHSKRLRDLFNCEVDLRGGTVQDAAAVVGELISDKDVIRYDMCTHLTYTHHACTHQKGYWRLSN